MRRSLRSWERALQAEGVLCSKGTEVSGKFKDHQGMMSGKMEGKAGARSGGAHVTLRGLTFILKAMRNR